MSVYYNENDAEKAEWLRELIRQHVVAEGEVDERSITEVQPEDLREFAQCHFFAGIGVWSYSLRLAGWPDDRPIWTGSCPCPSFSAAGKGGGFDDPRHLWPDWARLVRKCKPATIFGEQADDAIGFGWLDLVQTDLERENYAVGKAVLGACSVGAPHIRQRLYFVGSLAESLHAERWPKRLDREDGRDGQDGGRNETYGIVGTRGEVHGLEHPDRDRWPAREFIGAGNRHGSSAVAASTFDRSVADSHRRGQSVHRAEKREDGQLERCGESNLGEPKRAGLEGFGGDVVDGHEPRWFGAKQNGSTTQAGYVNGFWRDADWVLRKRWNSGDWEWCPTEPGTFPLVAGAPARVLRLRGYGDSICAEVAKAFIEAYCEIK